jgi:hypothetical protein
MRTIQFTFVTLTLISVLALTVYPQIEERGAVTAKEMQAHVDFLASDLLEGRDAGTDGAELAARYIATQFERLGLSRVVDGWEMEFDLPGTSAAGDAVIELGNQRFSGSTLIHVPRFSPTGSISGRLALEGDDLQGRLAVVEGWKDDKEAKKKAEALIERGAAGVCFISIDDWLKEKALAGDFRRMGSRGPGDLLSRLSGEDDKDGKSGEAAEIPDSIREMLEDQLGIDLSSAQVQVRVGGPDDLPDNLENFGDGEGNIQFSIGGPEIFTGSSRLAAPVIKVSRLVGDALIATAGSDGELKLDIPVKGSNVSTNVLAMVEGSDPVLRNEYVVIGGHYDHVGADGSGNVWNGADDNASGTAAVLEIAEALASMKIKPRRSILLAAWGAEERGLVGSRAFGKNPPVPKDKIVAYINLDMISRNDPGSISILSASEELNSWAEEATKANDFETRQMAGFFLFASDTAPFVQSNIPTVSFFSGMHGDYHRATDDPDTIDADKAARVTRAAFEVALRAANADEPPSFTRPDQGFPGGALSRGRGRVLGVFPDLDYEGEGVLVRQVAPDSVAAQAGIRAGDRILRIGEKSIRKTRDIREALDAVPAGKSFEIEINRPGKGDKQPDSKLILHGSFKKAV